MAKVYTNRGKLRVADGGFQTATKNLLAFKGSAPSAATVADWNFVSDLTGANAEAAAAGYARAAITSTLTENDTNDRVDISYSASVSLGAAVAAGETWIGVACFNTAGGADTARELYWVDVTASTISTNGSGISYTPANDTLS